MIGSVTSDIDKLSQPKAAQLEDKLKQSDFFKLSCLRSGLPEVFAPILSLEKICNRIVRNPAKPFFPSRIDSAKDFEQNCSSTSRFL